MRIDVIGRGIEITPAIKLHAETKAAKLPTYYDGVQQITFKLSPQGHQHKPQFDVEIVCDVEHHDDFVSHATGEDAYLAIDAAVGKASRQLAEFKERLKNGKH